MTELKLCLSIAVALFHCWKANLRINLLVPIFVVDVLVIVN
jgi:hypothetical protein